MHLNQRVDRFRLSRNVLSKISLRTSWEFCCVVSRYKDERRHKLCFYKLNFHIIYYHSICHINQSYFKTGTNNDLYFAATRSPLICTKAFSNSFSNCTEQFDYAPSEIARGIKSVRSRLHGIRSRLQVRW